MFLLRNSAKIIHSNLYRTTTSFRKCHRSANISDKSIWASNPDPKYTEVEEVKGHWKYVEKLLAKKVTVPPPPTKDNSVLGWRKAPDVVPDLPYFIARTRNHLLPVYVRVVPEGPHNITRVKNVRGDIWKLAQDLREYLQPYSEFKIRMCVDEVTCRLEIRDNHVERIKEWLYDKGF
ncbi:probable 39S ribosomal protein L49, mitochondrial [Centruroides sculpturatus]|uniref:probable 39S ribosomal protein L49, mitochondrial n=1 Tax=Centruroides sculpturatus TaxID=218467 RepID=UPI000C6E1289|nr:probable 39S ribosomal protein L49, mitochondrial [Centruroides sculpturatus]